MLSNGLDGVVLTFRFSEVVTKRHETRRHEDSEDWMRVLKWTGVATRESREGFEMPDQCMHASLPALFLARAALLRSPHPVTISKVPT